MYTEQLTQALSLPAKSLYPANLATNANAYVVGPLSTAIFRRLMAHIVMGAFSATNVQAVFQSSNANNGTFANVPNGPSITGNAANTEYTLEMRADQVPAGNSWVQLAVFVNGGTAAFLSASLYCGESGYHPGNQYDMNTTLMPTRSVMA